MPAFTGVANTEFVVVLIMEIEGVGKVRSGSTAPGWQTPSVQFGACTSSRTVVMSFALITKTGEESEDASTEIAPAPTVIVPVSRSPTTSITLTRLPGHALALLAEAGSVSVRWFTPAGQFPSAA